jgi:hypothetical protein
MVAGIEPGTAYDMEGAETGVRGMSKSEAAQPRQEERTRFVGYGGIMAGYEMRRGGPCGQETSRVIA